MHKIDISATVCISTILHSPLTCFLRLPSAWKDMMSILSGTLDLERVEEMVEAVEAEDLLEVDTVSDSCSQWRAAAARNLARR